MIFTKFETELKNLNYGITFCRIMENKNGRAYP